ncbi:peptidyl-prolyl cis-trans isomerase FKBP8-like [Formica exsecta]|uniref:peptidyl-prolyl cis-trans isomerase FKBP8-like n=1 Tax=Formica exsecta TaxID=72781 RepID=UPI0011449F37|nr:peptidyl-prolyl cis-trans isomerase FKBP8-like [Formica exsecta]
MIVEESKEYLKIVADHVFGNDKLTIELKASELESEIESISQRRELWKSRLMILLEDRIKVCNNLAAALIKTETYAAALKNVKHVSRCQPQNVKALFRKGTILRHKGEYAKAYAISLSIEIQKLNPEMKIFTTELIALKDKIAKDTEKKYLYPLFNYLLLLSTFISFDKIKVSLTTPNILRRTINVFLFLHL